MKYTIPKMDSCLRNNILLILVVITLSMCAYFIHKNVFISHSTFYQISSVLTEERFSKYDSSFETEIKDFTEIEVVNKTIKEESRKVHIEVNYPQFIGPDKYVSGINTHIVDKISRIIKEDKDILGPRNDLMKVSLVIDYRVIAVKNGILSMEFIVSDFTGGGNGNHDAPQSINWDLKTNRLLETRELFCSDDYSTKLAPIMEKLIVQDFNSRWGLMNNPLSKDIMEGIKVGLKPDVNNWNNVLLTEYGIVVIFSPYQVMSGSVGTVKEFVPYEDVPNIVCLP